MHTSSRSANSYFAAFARNLIKYLQSCLVTKLSLYSIKCVVVSDLKTPQTYARFTYKVEAAHSVKLNLIFVRIIPCNVRMIKLFFR